MAGASNQCSVDCVRTLLASISLMIALSCSAVAQTAVAQTKTPAPAIAWNNQGIQLAQQGRAEEAESKFRAALGAADDELSRAKIAGNLAGLYRREDRFSEAEQLYRSALLLRQKNLPAGDIDVAYALNNLGEIYHLEGRDWESRNLIETAARNLEDFHAEAPGLPIVLSNLAVLLCQFAEYDQAEETLRRALIAFQRQHNGVSSRYAVTLTNLADLLCRQRKFEEAAPFYDQAIGILKGLGVPAQSELASALAGQGDLYVRLKDLERGRQIEEQALGLLPPTGEALLRARILQNLGNILAAGAEPSDAMPYFEQSLVIQQKTLVSPHPATAGLLLDYASATQRAGNKSLARKLRKRAEDVIARLRSQLPTPMTVSLRELRENK